MHQARIIAVDRDEFSRDLAAVLNRHNIDTALSVPDFIVADHLLSILSAQVQLQEANREWHQK